MAGNGAPKKLVASITYDPTTGQVQLTHPEDLGQAYVLAKMMLDGVMNRALNPEPNRKVKTLDELGVNPLRGVK